MIPTPSGKNKKKSSESVGTWVCSSHMPRDLVPIWNNELHLNKLVYAIREGLKNKAKDGSEVMR